MSIQSQPAQQNTSPYHTKIVLLQLVTIVWMCAEAAVSLFAAVRAHSIALLGFGGDSVIELASAFVVLIRFKKISLLNETMASRITGLLLFLLAAFVFGSSVLALKNPRFRPEQSYLGIGLLIAAAIVMPWLSRQKRSLAARINSASLQADALQSSFCAYLAWIALGGLALNAAFKFSWADPAAALLLLPIVVREGWDAIQGRSCSDCTC